MKKIKHPIDGLILAILQNKGFIKKEAFEIIKNNVYKLNSIEVNKIKRSNQKDKEILFLIEKKRLDFYRELIS